MTDTENLLRIANDAVALIENAADISDTSRDVCNVLVNAMGTLARNPKATFRDVVLENWDSDSIEEDTEGMTEKQLDDALVNAVARWIEA